MTKAAKDDVLRGLRSRPIVANEGSVGSAERVHTTLAEVRVRTLLADVGRRALQPLTEGTATDIGKQGPDANFGKGRCGRTCRRRAPRRPTRPVRPSTCPPRM